MKMEMNKNIIIGVVAVIIIIGGAWWYFGSQSQSITGTIEIDGSSTVYPITQAVAEEFQNENPSVRINVGVSGTGGGMKRFTVGETDISDASRPIKDTEAEKAEQNGIEYYELKVAIDGIAVIINPENDFVDYLTVEELKMIWEPESTVDSWSDVRPEWPDQPIRLYGPGTDSGTFDYFTDVIVGEEGASRPDFTASEDDNVLVQGVAGDEYALGYFGFAYYIENTDKLKIVPVDSGNGPITPSEDTINAGEYTPLSRPIFIYVNKDALNRAEVRQFIEYYMEHAVELVSEVGYVPYPESVYLENIDLIS
jgi:phosphate transport system substrate-binding protein